LQVYLVGTLLLGLCVSIDVPLCAADITFRGRVVDENEAPVHDAIVYIESAAAASASAKSLQAQTDPTGAFTLTVPEAANVLVSVECEGFYALKNQPVHVESSHEFTFVINSVREVFQSENVNAATSPVDVAESRNEEHLSGTEMTDIPFSNSHNLRSSLVLLPGVITDGSGTLHVNGSAENQVLYLLNGFDLSNPISGRFQTILPVEGIRSVDLSSGQSSPEYGRGSAGALRLTTENGTDLFHYGATDFIPGLDIKGGLRLGNWYPRVFVSGPVMPGRAWFSDTFVSQYSQALVTGLPSGQNTTSSWAGSNLLHGQVNLTPANILFADFLATINNANRVGLGPLDPLSTTSTVDTRQYFASVKDQQYLGHGALVELGYGHNDFSVGQTPQGQGLYIISPQGDAGNYFANSTQAATRDQWLLHAFLPKFQWAGSHQFEAGGDVDWLHYHAALRDTGYQVLGLSGQLLSETLFAAPAAFSLADTEASAYLLDTWRVFKNLQLSLGLRADHDQKIDATAWSPRLGFSWSPFASARTRLSGGYSVTHDAVTLQMLGQPLSQNALTTIYNPEGNPAGAPVVATFAIPHAGLALPRADHWTLAADRQIASHVFLTAKYLIRRGTDGFAFINTLAPDAPPSLLPYPTPQSPATYQLSNVRRDRYDSIALSVRQTFSGQFEWMASYTYSRSLSNAVIDAMSPTALQVVPTLVPTPWNAPNRVLAFAYVPLPWKNWAVSGLADMRSGFPFSVRDQNGIISGAVDARRFPLHFDLNLAVERMLTFRGYRYALRLGMANVTGQANPTAVNSVVGTPKFLQFLGDEGRHFVVRIRFFGRAGK